MAIPASNLVKVIPGTLSAGAAPLQFNGMILTDNLLLPAGAPVPFASYQAVSNFFGPTSREAQMAKIYFTGYDDTTKLPEKLYFAFYDNGAPPPPADSKYYYLSDRASATDHTHIFHLLADLSAVHMWDGDATDILWASLPPGMIDNGNRDSAGVIVSNSYVYAFGYLAGELIILKRSLGASVGGNDWTLIAMPSDVPIGWNFGGVPPVVVDYLDNIMLLGQSDVSFGVWEQLAGNPWGARTDLHIGTEGDFTPKPGLVWAGAGRTQLVVYDFYTNWNFLLSFGTWEQLPSIPLGMVCGGLFSTNESDLWFIDPTPGSVSMSLYDGGAWDAPVFEVYSDFAPATPKSTCFAVTNGIALLVSATEFQSTAYGTEFTGVSSFDTSLAVDPLGPQLTFVPIFSATPYPVHAWPAMWVGSPGTGYGELLPDNTILHSATFIPV